MKPGSMKPGHYVLRYTGRGGPGAPTVWLSSTSGYWWYYFSSYPSFPEDYEILFGPLEDLPGWPDLLGADRSVLDEAYLELAYLELRKEHVTVTEELQTLVSELEERIIDQQRAIADLMKKNEALVADKPKRKETKE